MKRSTVKYISILIIISLMTLATVVVTDADNKDAVPSPNDPPILSAADPVQNQLTYLTISGIGDCMLGKDVKATYPGSFLDMFDKQKDPYTYFFSNVKPVLAADDLTIANLETTFTVNAKMAFKNFPGKPVFNFKGDPKYVNILKEGSVEAVTIANNHTNDYGPLGKKDTLATLDKAGISWFGYEKACVKNIKGIKVGMLGYKNMNTPEDKPNLKSIKKQMSANIMQLRKQCGLVIVTFHWGTEMTTRKHGVQTELGRWAIDNGADLVLGTHPHVVQGIEKYKGRYIVYSLANFCFGNKRNPVDRDTYIYQQTFGFNSNGRLVKALDKKIIPCAVSSTAGRNDYRPTVLSGKSGERVINKILAVSVPYNKTFSSALPAATANNQVSEIQKLLNSGANPDAKDSSGDTALIIAGRNNALNSVKILLAGGADPNLAGSNGVKPIDASASPAIRTMLIQYGAFGTNI
ncbi:MAG: CapA family protein [Acidobacteriota bacterium]